MCTCSAASLFAGQCFARIKKNTRAKIDCQRDAAGVTQPDLRKNAANSLVAGTTEHAGIIALRRRGVHNLMKANRLPQTGRVASPQSRFEFSHKVFP